ncbi:MAG TPA: chemotaxis protein CheW [Polyangiaceae bacterium]|nr:chemotaxis protein CheW [Polyangiaceae bacterium]
MIQRELPIAGCWKTIGVKGDRSCDKLVEVRHCHHCPEFEQAAAAFLNRPAPAAYAEEIAALLAAPSPSRPDPGERSAVLFVIGAQTLAIETGAVVEIAEPRPIRRIPHRTNRVFLGLVNVRGQLELCASLPGLLHIAPTPPAHAARARMLLIERLGQRWVIGADEVLGVHRLGTGGTSMMPATARQDGAFCIARLTAWETRQVGLLDLERMFSALQGSLA